MLKSVKSVQISINAYFMLITMLASPQVVNIFYTKSANNRYTTQNIKNFGINGPSWIEIEFIRCFILCQDKESAKITPKELTMCYSTNVRMISFYN